MESTARVLFGTVSKILWLFKGKGSIYQLTVEIQISWGDECSYQPVETKTHRSFWCVWEIPFIGGSFIAARTPLIYWCFFSLVLFFAACDRMVVSVSWSFVTLGNPSNPIETLSLRGHMTCCTLSELYGHTLLTAVSTTNMFLYFQYETTPDSSSSVNSKLINQLMHCCIASDQIFIPNAFSSQCQDTRPSLKEVEDKLRSWPWTSEETLVDGPLQEVWKAVDSLMLLATVPRAECESRTGWYRPVRPVSLSCL